MKKKILIGSIFAVLLILSMPIISNIQAESNSLVINKIIRDTQQKPAPNNYGTLWAPGCGVLLGLIIMGIVRAGTIGIIGIMFILAGEGVAGIIGLTMSAIGLGFLDAALVDEFKTYCMDEETGACSLCA
ncbi:MAG: hypothetical protein JSW62_03435 [Thermoplasmatales archaeon]|nr:MAG: hypothetical protein JSW62_03435 [Thermoplasmatales archaeon]